MDTLVDEPLATPPQAHYRLSPPATSITTAVSFAAPSTCNGFSPPTAGPTAGLGGPAGSLHQLANAARRLSDESLQQQRAYHPYSQRQQVSTHQQQDQRRSSGSPPSSHLHSAAQPAPPPPPRRRRPVSPGSGSSSSSSSGSPPPPPSAPSAAVGAGAGFAPSSGQRTGGGSAALSPPSSSSASPSPSSSSNTNTQTTQPRRSPHPPRTPSPLDLLVAVSSAERKMPTLPPATNGQQQKQRPSPYTVSVPSSGAPHQQHVALTRSSSPGIVVAGGVVGGLDPPSFAYTRPPPPSPPLGLPSSSSASLPTLPGPLRPPQPLQVIAHPPPLPSSSSYQHDGSTSASPGGSSGSRTPLRKKSREASVNGDDDLTSKGKKRKRLAKACTACHKNKRRCTGESPCSNCEFSGRECIYLSNGKEIPGPRANNRPRANSTVSSSSNRSSPRRSNGNGAGDGNASSSSPSATGTDHRGSSTTDGSAAAIFAPPPPRASPFSMGVSSLGEGFFGPGKVRRTSSVGSSSSTASAGTTITVGSFIPHSQHHFHSHHHQPPPQASAPATSLSQQQPPLAPSSGGSRFVTPSTPSSSSLMDGITEDRSRLMRPPSSTASSTVSLPSFSPLSISSSLFASPLTASSLASSPSLHPSSSMSLHALSSASSASSQWGGPSSSSSSTLALDPGLQRSLVTLFFRNFSDPVCSIFHRPSFWASLYEASTSPLLLNAIFAWAARLSAHPRFEQSRIERHLRGEEFATLVRVAVEKPGWKEEIIEGRKAGGCTEKEDIENAQTLLLMMIYESLMRRANMVLFYEDLLIPLLQRMIQQDNPPPPPSHVPLSQASTTARETRSRLFWMTYVVSVFLDAQTGRAFETPASALPTAAAFTAQDCRLALPVEDGRFEMGVCGEGLRPDTLTRPDSAESDVLVSELGHLARVARIFKDICALAAHTDKAVAAAGSPPPPTSAPGTTSMVSSQEAALKAWALGLPMHLQFNEGNLSSAVEKISGRSSGGSNLGGERGSGFAALHTAAEVTMFFHIQTLRSAPGTDTKQKELLASRQSQAVENIAFVLNAIGSRGRRNPSMFFPLFVVSRWRALLDPMTADPRLSSWWADNRNLWGLDRDCIQAKGFLDGTTTMLGNLPATPDLCPLTIYAPASAKSAKADNITTVTPLPKDWSSPAPLQPPTSPALGGSSNSGAVSSSSSTRLPSIQALNFAPRSSSGSSKPNGGDPRSPVISSSAASSTTTPSMSSSSSSIPSVDTPGSSAIPTAGRSRTSSSASATLELPSFPLVGHKHAYSTSPRPAPLAVPSSWVPQGAAPPPVSSSSVSHHHPPPPREWQPVAPLPASASVPAAAAAMAMDAERSATPSAMAQAK